MNTNGEEILRSFSKKIVEFFGNELIFGFLCGSIIKKECSQESDIDMFICVKQKKHTTVFFDWYHKIHAQYGLKADQEFPGEIMELNILDYKLRLTKNATPTRFIIDANIYDGIIWAGMLSGDIGGFIGSSRKFNSRRLIGAEIIDLWSNALCKGSQKYGKDLQLKRIIKYKKCDDL